MKVDNGKLFDEVKKKLTLRGMDFTNKYFDEDVFALMYAVYESSMEVYNESLTSVLNKRIRYVSESKSKLFVKSAKTSELKRIIKTIGL